MMSMMSMLLLFFSSVLVPSVVVEGAASSNNFPGLVRLKNGTIGMYAHNEILIHGDVHVGGDVYVGDNQYSVKYMLETLEDKLEILEERMEDTDERHLVASPPPPPPPSSPPKPPPSSPYTYVTINGKELYQDSDGWILSLGYKHAAQEKAATVPGVAPLSTEGYSHIWPKDLSLSVDDIISVRFYCTSSSHARIVHFSTENEWVKNALVNGSLNPNESMNQNQYWTEGTVKFPDHSASLPDSTSWASYDATQDLTGMAFSMSEEDKAWSAGGLYGWACDDSTSTAADTLHQIWFKRKS